MVEPVAKINQSSGKSESLIRRYPWAVFIVPFVVYMLLASMEPKRVQRVPTAGVASEKEWKWFDQYFDGRAYATGYSLRLMATVAVMFVFLAGYRQFPWNVSILSVVVGVVGIFVWVGLCQLKLEETLLAPLGLKWLVASGERAAFNPFDAFANNMPWLIVFLFVRFTGLAVVVPIIEEFLLRGFVLRIFVDQNWSKVPFGHASKLVIVITIIYGVAAHPAEAVAAAAWFSLVTWLMVKTRNIWDCVVAHAITNLLLGIYVLSSGEWHLW